MPSLPFELERRIFEIAALQDTDHNNRIQIMLVAKRVYEWIRPILYRVVVFRVNLVETPGALTIRNWPNAQITNSARFVRHLHLASFGRTSHELGEMISTFPNIENFACWGITPISREGLQQLNDLPLRRLSLYLKISTFHEAIEHCPLFKNLTHLELLYLNERQGDIKFRELPKLTHLAFAFSGHVEDAGVLDLLKQCASLRVLICFARPGGRPHSPIKLDDPRCLVFRDHMSLQDFIEEWVRSANGLVGFWELGEVIIDARKANLFKDTAPSVLSRKTWMEHLNDDGKRWYKEST